VQVKELFEEVVLPFCQAFPDITRRLMAAATAAAAAAADSDDKQQPRGAAKGRKQPRSTSAATASGGPPAKKRKTRKQQQQAEEEEEEEMTEEAVRSALWPVRTRVFFHLTSRVVPGKPYCIAQAVVAASPLRVAATLL
jgi:hypothetical protein